MGKENSETLKYKVLASMYKTAMKEAYRVINQPNKLEHGEIEKIAKMELDELFKKLKSTPKLSYLETKYLMSCLERKIIETAEYEDEIFKHTKADWIIEEGEV